MQYDIYAKFHMEGLTSSGLIAGVFFTPTGYLMPKTQMLRNETSSPTTFQMRPESSERKTLD